MVINYKNSKYYCNFCIKETKYTELKVVHLSKVNDYLLKPLIKFRPRKRVCFSCRECYEWKHIKLIKNRRETQKNLKDWYRINKNI